MVRAREVHPGINTGYQNISRNTERDASIHAAVEISVPKSLSHRYVANDDYHHHTHTDTSLHS